MNSSAWIDALAQAMELHRAGELDAAEAVYRRLMAEQPEQPDPWHLTGLVCHQRGDHAAGEQLIRAALERDPHNILFLCNLASVVAAAGQHAQAETLLRQVLERQPDFTKAWYNLGNELRALGRLDEALEAYRRALAIQPDYGEAHTNLGVTLRALDRPHEALVHYRRAVELSPQLAQAHFNLGNLLRDLAYAERGHNPLAAQQQYDSARASYAQALAINPSDSSVHTNLGAMYKETGQLDEAISCYERALAADAQHVESYSNLAVAYQDRGELDPARAFLSEALRRRPTFVEAHSNLVFLANYEPEADPRAVYEAHCEWARRHTVSLPAAELWPRVEPGRPLRVGYVSPDLRSHPVGRFIAAVLEHHDRRAFEPLVYADVPIPDRTTERLRSHVARWRNTHRLSDAELYETIRADEVDVLVDLAGHTSMNRLLVFARRAAPVQATYLGYPNTTGLATMDFFLTDAIADPPDSTQPFTEQLVRLSPCFSCYTPPDDVPEVSPLPALSHATITFGSLHSLAKLNARVLDLWGAVLRAVPSSRLLVYRNTLSAVAAERLRRELAARGVSAEQLWLRFDVPIDGSHWSIYRDVDIALDTFPWTGHTTACEALWMGVPTITLRGSTHAGRMVASVLAAAGEIDAIAENDEHFVAIAQRWARDRRALAERRASARRRMAASPLCDGVAFTRRFERALLDMVARQAANVAAQATGSLAPGRPEANRSS